MAVFSIAAAAAAPGIALLSYIYLKDRYEAEPIAMVARLFVFGLLSVFPVMVLQRGFELWLDTSNPFLFSFVTTAALEESAKWLIIAFAVLRHAEFDEPYDGIVYATAVSLGFATMENMFYAFLEPFSMSSLMVRALLPVSGHALFGIIMGYYFGRAKFTKAEKSKFFAFSWLFPVFYHGLFDFILLTAAPRWMWLIVPLMAFLWARGLLKIKRANQRSPLRGFTREEEFKM
ncbi:glutamic-type intramembrane protease PrsW [Paenibacillus sp.]|uniref:glutamic-type intramembrane protease PrsW n=1 Tax=Paenibacillus sp. TaxID=58172 RepID=UPI002D5136BB|nr:glutamic-type intramembrane protease PrsW [Paenibacillus sp.]HZG85215.1 glutamic-type intramembrane protease PrsW [Paenibacillus sp.]